MASKVTVDGFRKGKVPLSIMRKQFGERASSEAVIDNKKGSKHRLLRKYLSFTR
jgi:FKBP-type peptidyl-prolyl cis-trans isomerase (trigger factor)